MAYKVIFNMDDGTTLDDLLEEVFETEEEAEEAAAQCSSDYSQGRDYLEEAGEDFCEEEIVDWDIVEVDDD